MKPWLRQNYYFILTFSMVTLLGWQTYSDLISFEREDALQTLTDKNSIRAPASLHPDQGAADFGEVMDWDCGSQPPKPRVVAAGHVRIKFTGCSARELKKIIDIKNDSNGSTATVFSLSKARFETDLIPLSPGHNKISFSYVDAKGSNVVETIEVNQVNK